LIIQGFVARVKGFCQINLKILANSQKHFETFREIICRMARRDDSENPLEIW